MSQTKKEQIRDLYMDGSEDMVVYAKNRCEITEEMRKKHREQFGLDGAFDTDEHILNLQSIKPSGVEFGQREHEHAYKKAMNVMQSKYDREIKSGVYVDVYDVLCCFNVTNPAIAHAVKKLLMPGNRGHKDIEQDLHEAIQSIYRGIEIEEEKIGITHVI